MAHVIERARTGRAKCRGCGQPIASGALRFGERLPNPFAEGEAEMTHWFHVPCAAFMRPEAFLETLPATTEAIEARDQLEAEARIGIAHHRVPRVTTVGRAPTGRAACRACKEPIAKDAWRIALMFYEEGRFVPSGFIHVGCAKTYLETTDIMVRLKHFSPAVSEPEFAEIHEDLARGAPG